MDDDATTEPFSSAEPAGGDTVTVAEARRGWGRDARGELQVAYRVVEVLRDGSGRLRREGSIWHTDLNTTRRFGRALASNSTATKVQITDSSGDVLEELPTPRVDLAQPRWNGWQHIPLPPCPPRVRRRSPKPKALIGSGAPNPFAAIEMLEELKEALADQQASAEAQAQIEPRPAPGSAGTDDDVEVLLP